MDKGEILRDYKAAKNHKRQIPILAELNACDKEKIIEILNSGGYTMVFNTNGVDISTKLEEIKGRLQKGESVATLAKAYHVSQKAMRNLLGIEEMEENNTVDDADKTMQDDKKLIEQLGDMVNSLTAERDELLAKLSSRDAQIERLNYELDRISNDYERESGYFAKYNELCIKNNQLNATIDILIEKISILKAVCRNG